MLTQRAANAHELIDGPIDHDALERTLDDLAIANRWFGGYAPIRRELRRCGAARVLDVGSGGGDIPRRLVRETDGSARPLRITCLDRSPAILAVARRRCGDDPRLRFVQADGEQLPFADDSFDAAICTLTLHHLEPAAAVRLLRELRRVAETTPVVCDLVRSATAFAATWAFAHVIARGTATRHDGPLSVRRAYTPREALALARAAGWRAPRVRREAFFHMTLVDG